MKVSDLNVLLVISKMGKGGAQRIVLDLANALVAEGAQVDLLIFYRTEQDQSILAELDSRVRLLDIFPLALAFDHQNSPKKFLAFLLLPFLAFWWTVSGKMSKYHIVHGNLMLASFFIWICFNFQFMSRKPAPKYIETFHGDLISLLPWEKGLFFLFWKTSDGLIVELSRKDLKILQDKMPGHYIQYIPFGVKPLDMPDQKEITEYKSAFGNTPIILSIMRLHQQQKRVLDLLMVIDQFRKIYREPFVYLLVGDGPDRQRAQEYVKSTGLEDYVVFTGYVNDIELLCAGARAFLIAGIEDLVGIAGLQAASLGVPVVSFQIDNGWKKPQSIFFNSSSIEILAEELKELVINDAYYRDASSYAANTVRSTFSVAQMTDSYVQVYTSLVEKK